MSRPRLHDPGYLLFLSKMACCICGKEGETQACHIKIGHFTMAKKPDDRFCVPMCIYHHREQHGQNEERFWIGYGLDPYQIAERLYLDWGGDGGHPRKRKTAKPRKPASQRQKIASRKTQWPKRKFQTLTTGGKKP